MPNPHAPAIGPLSGAMRSLGRLFGAQKTDPLETRLTHAGSAGTPLTADEAVDIAAARAEIRRGESTTAPSQEKQTATFRLPDELRSRLEAKVIEDGIFMVVGNLKFAVSRRRAK